MNRRLSMVVWNDFRNDYRVLKEAETLQSSGWHVVVHAVHSPGLTVQREILDSGICVRRVKRSPFHRSRGREAQPVVALSETSQKLAWRLWSSVCFGLKLLSRTWAHLCLLFLLIRSRPAIVLAHDVNTLPTGWLAAKLVRAKLVYDAHEISTSREGYRAVRSLVYRLEKALMPKANACMTTTEFRARFFRRAYNIPSPLVLQNRPRATSAPCAATDRLQRELGIAEGVPIAIYQGGMQSGRGLIRLIDAVAQVPRLVLVMIGGGRQLVELKRHAEEKAAPGQVYFIDTVPLEQLPSYTASAHIGVQPIENTCLNHLSTDSNKLFEYIGAGLPVVASAMPEIRKVIQKYKLGVCVPPGDTDKLVGALRELTARPEMRSNLADNARTAAADLTWEAQEHHLVEQMARVAGYSLTDKGILSCKNS